MKAPQIFTRNQFLNQCFLNIEPSKKQLKALEAMIFLPSFALTQKNKIKQPIELTLANRMYTFVMVIQNN